MGYARTTYEYSLRLPLSVTPLQFLPVNKRLESLEQVQLISKSASIYTKICLTHKHQTIWRSWRKVSSTIFIAITFC